MMMFIKTRLFFLFTALIFISCNETEDKNITSSDIFLSYQTQKDVSIFNVPPGMVSVFLDDSKKGNTELKNLLSDINQLTFLIFEKDSNANKNCKYYNEISLRLDSINFNDLAQINSGRELVKVKFEGDSNKFNELIFLVSNYNSLYCISFKGKIDPHKVAQLVKQENISAVSNLDRFEKK